MNCQKAIPFILVQRQRLRRRKIEENSHLVMNLRNQERLHLRTHT